MAEFITFLLAPIGYAGLTITAVMAARGHLPVWFWRAIALVMLSHVVLVWAVRYGWQFSEATRNGYVGFVLFHGALLAVFTSVFVRESLARPLVIGVFGIVTLGALGAVFTSDVVAIYRIPVILCAALGVGGLVHVFLERRRRALRV